MATKSKTTTSAGTTMSPMDMVQNPNFNSLMKNQNYFNMISQLLAERQARGPEAGLMPIPSPEEARRMEAAMAERNAALTSGTARPANDPEFIDSREPGKNYTANMVNYVDPTTGQMVARTAGIVPRPGSRFVPAENFQTPNQPIPAIGNAMPQANANFSQTPNPPIPTSARAIPPARQMGQMANYNQMLQQGMRRNQDMNQAAQNLAAPAGPARSFSQVAGGTRRMNRMPRQPRNNSLAPSNRRLI
jgi:hypothetical protein